MHPVEKGALSIFAFLCILSLPALILDWPPSITGLIEYFLICCGISVYPLYLFCLWSDPSEVVPFRFWSAQWRVRRARFSSPRALAFVPDDDRSSFDRLCSTCAEIVSRSGLLVGSSRLLTPMTEWYDLYASLERLERSLTRPCDPCHLCTLLWHSVSQQSRRVMLAEDRNLRDQLRQCLTQNSDSPSLPVSYKKLQASHGQLMRLQVKVWEVRPISKYSYVQLFRGNKPVGARLLVTREKGETSMFHLEIASY